MAVSGAGLAIVSIGAIFVYGGLKGKSPLTALQGIVKGTSPASLPQTQGITPTGPSVNAGGNNTVVDAAVSQIGKPYIWDTPLSASNSNPASFDCSGLSMWCYAKAGVKLDHNTITQYSALNHVPVADAAPGDLIFFGIAPAPHHVGIYTGNGQMIDAPTTGIPVGYRDIHESDLMAMAGQFPGNGFAATSSGQSASANPGTRGDQAIASSPASNQAIAQLLLGSYGWSAQWAALDSLWSRESSWSNTAENPSSGAYGIAQALPATKMPKAAQSPATGGTSDPTAQIKWGLSYIRSRYGDPNAAWAHEQSVGWY